MKRDIRFRAGKAKADTLMTEWLKQTACTAKLVVSETHDDNDSETHHATKFLMWDYEFLM